jgi:FtsP/CotA-like multicopper oxidase with cupredoxin domain
VTSAPIGRRHAIGLIGLGAVGVAAGITGWVTGLGGPSTTRLRPAGTGEPLRQPEVAASRDGVLDLLLTAAPGVRLAGHDTSAWGFNGTSPGPTLRVLPGDLLRVRLANRLPQPTNLHTHGLHVSPQGNGDNPFVSIEPGSSFDYAIQVPPDHPAGTFWYHPHHHGTVADQIFAGLAGALIVEAEPDLAVAADRVLMVTDTTLDGAGRVVQASDADKAMGREGDLVLVNGQHQPVIAASTGAVERWRVINGCVSRVLALRLDGHRLTHIALDGMFLPHPVDRDQVILAPGNRADLLAYPTGSGRYELIGEPYNRGSTMMMGGNGGRTSTRSPVTLAVLAVSGPAAASPPLPATLPSPPIPQGPVAAQRQLTFAMTMGAGMGMGSMTFTIDGQSFDARRDDQSPRAPPRNGRSSTPAPWTTRSTCTPGLSTSWMPATAYPPPAHNRTWSSYPPTDRCACASRSPTTPAAASTTATPSITRTTA